MNQAVFLRKLVRADAQEFIVRLQASRSLHQPWVRPPETPDQFAAYQDRMDEPQNHALGVWLRSSGVWVGVVTITNVVHGAFRSGYLGYYVFSGYEHQGLMQQGLSQVVRHAFKALGPHRLEADIQPGNFASIRLVHACGFSEEGFSPKYLKISGRWRDHERWAIVAR